MSKLHQFFDALSLSGALILIFTGLTVVGIFRNDEKVWDRFGTALTTFATGKVIGKYEAKKDDIKKDEPV